MSTHSRVERYAASNTNSLSLMEAARLAGVSPQTLKSLSGRGWTLPAMDCDGLGWTDETDVARVRDWCEMIKNVGRRQAAAE